MKLYQGQVPKNPHKCDSFLWERLFTMLNAPTYKKGSQKNNKLCNVKGGLSLKIKK